MQANIPQNNTTEFTPIAPKNRDSSQSSHFSQKKYSSTAKKAIALGLVVVLFSIGLASAVLLMGQNQDLRQYAKETSSTSQSIIFAANQSALRGVAATDLPRSLQENPEFRQVVIQATDANGSPLTVTQDLLKNTESMTLPSLLVEGKSFQVTKNSELSTKNEDLGKEATTGSFIWSGNSGRVDGNPPDTTLNIVSGNEDFFIGTLHTTEGVFNLAKTKDGSMLLYEVPEDMSMSDEVLEPSLEDSGLEISRDEAEVQTRAQMNAQTLDGDGEVVITVLAGYTTAAKDREGGSTAIQTIIDLGIANTNTALANSSTGAKLVRVGLFKETNYIEDTASCFECNQPRADLRALANPADGFMDDLTEQRLGSLADILLLVTTGENYGNFGGISQIAVTPSAAYPMSAVNISSLRFRRETLTNHLITHEIAHIFGAHHDRDTLGGFSPIYTYGRGVRKNGGATQVAYRENTNDVRLNYYSTPLYFWNGDLMGSFDAEYNAKVIKDNASTVAEFNGGSGGENPEPPGQGGDGTCDNNVPVNSTACAAQGDSKQFRCMVPNPNQEWQEEACNAGGTCQGYECSNGSSGGGGTPPAPQITCETGNFQARFRVNYVGGTDHGWIDGNSFMYGSPPYMFQNFEHAVFMNGDTAQFWDGEVVLTRGDSEFVFPNGNIRTVLEPWMAGRTYKIAPRVNGVKCAQHETTITITAAPVPETSPIGNFENISANYTATGWSCDPDNFQQPLQINFYADGPAGQGTLIGSATANMSREAGVGTACGGRAASGFSFTIPEQHRTGNGGQRPVYAVAINIGQGTDKQLEGSPKSFATIVPVTVTPPSFRVILDQSTQKAAVAWNGTDSAVVDSWLIERCSGATCSNFSEIATVANTPYVLNTYTDSTSIPSGQVFRYRARAKKGTQLGPYSEVKDSSVSWVFVIKAVCANGSTPANVTRPIVGTFPPTPVSWQQQTTQAGTHTLNVTNTHSWSSKYVVLNMNNVPLVPRGNSPHPAITFSTYFVPSTPMFKADRSLPSGTYTINYTAPVAACGTAVNPVPPANFTGTLLSDRRVRLRWSAQTNIPQYTIQRCIGASCTNFTTIRSQSGTEYTSTAIPQGQVHRFRVRANSGTRYGGYSSVVSF